MERQRAKNNTRRSQIEVVTDWQHTQELTPAFRRLMRLLLEPSPQLNNKKGVSDEAAQPSP